MIGDEILDERLQTDVWPGGMCLCCKLLCWIFF